jgi:metallo-beta-lactamase family protein
LSATLQFLGAAETVTGSRFLLRTEGARVLVDCGLFQGAKALRLRNWAPFPIAPRELDAVVLTHAHVDHAGFVPRLVAEGFRGPVFATRGSEALCGVVLPDSGRLHEEDANLANAEGWSKHVPALPLYTEADALRSLQQFRCVETGAWFEPAPGVRGRFARAGHILGAASLVLEDSASGKRAGFSGDLGRPAHPLLGASEPMARVDALVCESTYGDRRHPPSAQVVAALGAAIARTAERGGAIVIPAFAVDRTEVVLLHLRDLMHSGAAPRLPVYVDSPMALAALAIYRRAIAERWPEIRPDLRGDAALFDPGDLREVRTLAQSRELQAGGAGPCIIVSASGMATGGRVLRHLARHLPDARSSVVLVGYQVPGTRGHRLLRGERTLKLLGRYVPVRAEIVNLAGFSVHADADETLAWLGSAEAAPGICYAVHGEPEPTRALAARIDDELGWAAVAPRDGELVKL